jgi:hypothetical protein
MPTPADIAAAFIEAGDWAKMAGDVAKGQPDGETSVIWYQRSARYEEQAVLLFDLIGDDMATHDYQQELVCVRSNA